MRRRRDWAFTATTTTMMILIIELSSMMRRLLSKLSILLLKSITLAVELSSSLHIIVVETSESIEIALMPGWRDIGLGSSSRRRGREATDGRR